MTTILISILSGVLGLIVGFTIGIFNSAMSAKQIGDWTVGMSVNKSKKAALFSAKHIDGDQLDVLVHENGIITKTNCDFDFKCDKCDKVG